jgi:hypothetical protein
MTAWWIAFREVRSRPPFSQFYPESWSDNYFHCSQGAFDKNDAALTEGLVFAEKPDLVVALGSFFNLKLLAARLEPGVLNKSVLPHFSGYFNSCISLAS